MRNYRLEHMKDFVIDTASYLADEIHRSKKPTKGYIKSVRKQMSVLSFCFLISLTALAIATTLIVIYNVSTSHTEYTDSKSYSSVNESIIYNNSEQGRTYTLSKDYTEDTDNSKRLSNSDNKQVHKASYMLSVDYTEDEEFLNSVNQNKNPNRDNKVLFTSSIETEVELETEGQPQVESESEQVTEITKQEETEIEFESEQETERVRVIPCTDEERLVAQYIVEMEAHDLSYEHKQRIMGVIVNRMYSDVFPNQNTLLEVMTAPDQFSSLFNFYNPVYYPNEDTVNAVDSIIYGDADLWDVSQGALFFYNPDRSGGYKSFFENREYIDSMDGHRFFR